MIKKNEVDYANDQMTWLMDRFGDRLTDEYYRVIRLELISAFRHGYEKALLGEN